ncbi:Malate dehydrogenase [Eumeta japonica]|uniref:Malate dehydrogenase n=1 Tax=Eumeta variegata TaxID=151549 RepID=A0A4C1ZDM6_EUMVA|nr:Malate dehydrogenase [Eumeta japonica]
MAPPYVRTGEAFRLAAYYKNFSVRKSLTQAGRRFAHIFHSRPSPHTIRILAGRTFASAELWMQGALGTNPIAVAAAASDGDSLLVDMAATTVALGKIEMQRRKKESIPNGWALGPDGKETNDAELAFQTGCLMPLGGGEQTAGYKGYGLSAIGELFCGISSGSKYGHHVRPWSLTGEGGPPDLGQCYVAIDPGCFAPGFGDRLADCLQYWRSLEPVDPSLPVLAPGDKERLTGEETDRKGAINYVQQQLDSCVALANKLGVKPMKIEK